MNRQCYLQPIWRPTSQEPDRVKNYTHYNKGKVYPYSSWRGTKAGRRGTIEREFMAKLRERENDRRRAGTSA